MSSLRVLDLSRNRVNSLFPIIPNLVELDLSSNEFKQFEHIGITKQCHLKKLSASYNYFDKEMIDSQTNLSECSNYFLERLDLSWSLNGTIPKPLGRLANLRFLHLSGNGWVGPIPRILRRLRFLEVLDLSYNELSGPLPTFVGKLSKLDLSSNQLNGSISESLGKLATLTYLNLEFNRLTGPIPTSLGRLVSLQTISVSSNLLSGDIPVTIGKLPNLHSLDMSNNSLEGVVSEAHFANLSMLKHLDTSFNTKLTFNISSKWIPPFQLVTLQLRSCNIANEFPKWLQNQRKLKELVLSNATLLGPLPTWLQKMPFIPFLDLSYNLLTGPLTNLPNEGNFDVFENGVTGALYLENNFFNESIPRSLCQRTDLEYLDLSSNRLSGNIPKCLENMQKLLIMRFSSNQLSGVIPSSIALKSSSLVRLQLNDNKFIGDLPQELGNFRDLRVLDLGDNKFSANIPEWIGEKLTSLMVLRLHNNKFSGRIPESLCRSSNLQILDVAYNNLTGTIPRCLGDLNAMLHSSAPHIIAPYSDESLIQVFKGINLDYRETWQLVLNMDLSSNKLGGKIPSELTALSMLYGLNLSNNHLSGGIPGSIGDMKNLESLDFSKNNLIGMIPPSMGALSYLSNLNLSHNNLCGQIPIGNQLETLTDPSIYAGNKDLCGTLLRKDCSSQECHSTTSKKKYKPANEPTRIWLFYVDIISGFVTGFSGVIGVLSFKKQWRHKLFMFAEETIDMIYVTVVIRVAKMKRGTKAI